MFIFLSSDSLLQYGRGDLEVPGQGLVSLKSQVWRLQGNRTERKLKSHLSFIEWSHWFANYHKDAPIGRLLHGFRHLFKL